MWWEHLRTNFSCVPVSLRFHVDLRYFGGRWFAGALSSPASWLRLLMTFIGPSRVSPSPLRSHSVSIPTIDLVVSMCLLSVRDLVFLLGGTVHRDGRNQWGWLWGAYGISPPCLGEYRPPPANRECWIQDPCFIWPWIDVRGQLLKEVISLWCSKHVLSRVD